MPEKSSKQSQIMMKEVTPPKKVTSLNISVSYWKDVEIVDTGIQISQHPGYW